MKTRPSILKATGLVFPLLGIAATVALGIYLSATQTPSYSGKTIIRWVVDAHPIRKVTIALFEKQYPDVHVINDPDSGSQRLLTQIAGAVPPDVMALYEPETIRMFARNDILLDLRPYVEKYNIPVNEFHPQLKPYVYYGNKIVGIPENCCSLTVFYNKKLFDAAGVPYPKDGWTWDDCLKVSQKLTVYKTIGNRKVAVQKGLCVPDMMWSCFTWMYGGSVFSPDGKKCIINSPEVKKGWRYWADLRLKYHVTPTASEAQSMAPTGGYGGDFLLFSQGKVAMMITGRYMIPEYRKQTDLEWDVVDLPKGPHPMNLFLSKSYCIPKTCKNKDAAVKFVRHLMSKENELLIANYGDGLPTRNNKEIIKGFLYNPEYPKEKRNAIYLDSLKYARATEMSPYISNVDLNSVVGMQIGRMWLEEITPEEACDIIAEQVNNLIKRNIKNPNFLD